MAHLQILLVVAAGLLSEHAWCLESQPHIVFIMVDDLGHNDVGYQGSEIHTPNIDKLANEGVVLDNYYTAPVCGPTRAQLLSGRYSTHLGLQLGNIIACHHTGLPTRYPTIADKLREQGYSTNLIGKWHSGFHTEAHLPNNRGFDTFSGFLLGHGDHYTHTRPFRGKEYLDYYNNTTPYNVSWGDYSTDIMTDTAVELIRQHNETNPMFMFLSYQAPHNPLQVPQRYLSQYSSIPITIRRIYAGMVTAIDEGIGRVMDALRSKGMDEDIVVIFSTDNGGDVRSGGSNFPLSGNKGSLYQGGVKGVGFVWSPHILRPKRVMRHAIHVTDWMPTLLHLAGEDNLEGLQLDGYNQWEAISMAEHSNRTDVLLGLSASNNQGLTDQKKSMLRRASYVPQVLRDVVASSGFDVKIRAAIVNNNWKLVTGGRFIRHDIYSDPIKTPFTWIEEVRSKRSRKGPRDMIQLYNLRLDPSEKTNLATSYVGIVQDLLRKLANHKSSVVRAQQSRFDPKCDPALNGNVWGPFA